MLAAPALGTGLSLQEIEEHAIAHGPDVVSAESQRDRATAEAGIAVSTGQPTLGLETRHGWRGSEPTASDSSLRYPSNAALKVRWPLLDQGLRAATQEAAELVVTAATAAVAAQRVETRRKIANLFFGYQRTLQAMLGLERQMQGTARLVAQIEGQFRDGFKTRLDFLRIQATSRRTAARLSRTKADLLRAERDLFVAAGYSLENSGWPKIRPYTIDEALEERTRSRAATLRVVRAEAAERIQALETQTRILEQRTAVELEAARRRHGWRLDLATDVSYGASGYLGSGRTWDGTDVLAWGITLDFTYPLWDAGLSGFEVARVAATHREQAVRQRAETQAARAEYVVLTEEIRGALNDFETARDLRKIERESYAFAADEYRMGRTNFATLGENLDRLEQAELQAIERFFDLSTILYQYEIWVGGTPKSDPLSGGIMP